MKSYDEDDIEAEDLPLVECSDCHRQARSLEIAFGATDAVLCVHGDCRGYMYPVDDERGQKRIQPPENWRQKWGDG